MLLVSLNSWHRCIVIAMLIWLGSPEHTRAEAPVEGDIALLQVLLDAQVTGSSRHQRGRMEFGITERRWGLMVREGEFVWDGPLHYWRFSGEDTPAQEERKPQVYEDVEIIFEPGRLTTHNPLTPFVTQTERPKSVREPLEFMFATPAGWRQIGILPKSFEKWLDWRQATVPYVVRREPDDIVSVERTGAGGLHSRVLASLQAGGNIISYRMEMGDETGEYADLFKGKFDWSPDGSGGWYPTEIVHEQCHADDPETPYWSYRLEVLAFETDPVIPPDRFELTSLNIAPGTPATFINQSGQTERRWRYGGPANPDGKHSREELDRLGRKLRGDGFADPERDKP